MKLLVIGGSKFVGRHLVEAAAARGDHVTVFNRGTTPAQWPRGVHLLQGDRKGDLSALSAPGEGGSARWDAVVDTCGYLPADVARMAEALHGRVERYVFVSSVSAYASFERPNDESAALGQIDDADTTLIDGRTYGPLKALCEAALTARFGASASLVLRPGLIVGPHDPTQRFTYWPARLARAAPEETVLAPGTPADPVQFIDARDLAAFILLAIERRLAGVYNTVAPAGAVTMGQLLQACADAAGTRPRWFWAAAADLVRCDVKPWNDLPLWLPHEGEHAAFMATDSRAAHAEGLHCRPIDETVADTLAWFRGLPPEQQVFDQAGLSAEREAEVLGGLRATGAPRPPLV